MNVIPVGIPFQPTPPLRVAPVQQATVMLLWSIATMVCCMNCTTRYRKAMGMRVRVRLKASFNISSYPASAQVIFRALKKYGMIVADNGSDWYVAGTADARWNDAELNTLKQLRGSDFEVVRITGIVTP